MRTQLLINNKFAEYNTDSLNIELFNSQAFDQIALINYKNRTQHTQEILIEKFTYAQNEMLAYIPFCVHPMPKRALVCGTLNCEIAYLLAKEGLEVDIIMPDKEAFYTLSGFLPHFKEITQSNRISLYDNFLSLKTTQYDIVIHLGEIKNNEFSALGKLANQESILIYRLHNLYLETNLALQTLDVAKDFSHILMPFVVCCLENNFYIFASKKFHPLADLILQKSDMLENLHFYNANIHTSAFRLPNRIQNIIAPYVKN
ncbi:spermidine synthase spee [Helicobacter sp. MIT 14-3879]|nr:spermidine synthase spee [Helicobacter sp. MIT 14-3879]